MSLRPNRVTRSRTEAFGPFSQPKRAGSFVFLVAVWLISAAYPFWLRFNFDAAWFYYVAEQVLKGQRLYVDIIEINPPLIVWLTMPPVLLGRLLNVQPRIAFTIYVLVILAGSLSLSAVVLRRTLPDRPFGRRALLLVLPVVLVQFVYAAFGEREHLMLAMVLPYLFLAAGRASDRSFSGGYAVAVGVFAALGIALKPHFVLLFVVAECYLLLHRRPRAVVTRPEFGAIVLVLSTYAAAAVLLTPEYAAVVKLTRRTYWALSVPFAELLTEPLFVGSLLILLLAWRVPISPELQPLRQVMVLAGGAFAAAMLVQQKGWFYHQYPVMATAVLSATVVLADKMEGRFSGSAQRRLRLTLTAGFVVIMALFTFSPGPPNVLTEDLLRPVIETHARGGSVLFLSTQIGDAFPLAANTRVGNTSPFASLWFLPGLYARRPAPGLPIAFRAVADQPPIERDLARMLVDAAVEAPPELIIVNSSPYQPGFGWHRFDYIGYFGQDPRFARLLQSYAPVAEIPPFLIYGRTAPQAERQAELE